jgi:hypothetical protein
VRQEAATISRRHSKRAPGANLDVATAKHEPRPADGLGVYVLLPDTFDGRKWPQSATK